MKNKRVMVFGVFDRLHDGHLHFLKQASGYGELIVVVARDKAVAELKNRLPLEEDAERLSNLEKLSMVSRAVLGDEVQGAYEVIKKYKPDIICLGYDQEWLKGDLEEKMKENILSQIQLIQMTSLRPDEFHSSLLSSLR